MALASNSKRHSTAVLARNKPGGTSIIPRLNSDASTAARLTAVRCPAVASETLLPCTCKLRARSLRRVGSTSTSSSTRSLPAASVPVTMVPKPRSVNERSMASRNGPSLLRAGAIRAHSTRASRNSTSPVPVFALTATIGAAARNVPVKNSANSSLTRSSNSGSTRSALFNAMTPERSPNKRQISKCSRVCGISDSSAAITNITMSIPAAPASMFLMKRSWPGTSTKPSRNSPHSRCAKPRSIEMPRSFSSFSRSVSIPVSARTSAVLP